MWDPHVFNLRAFKFVVGIGFQRGSNMCMRLLNIYAPFSNKKVFWDRVDASGIEVNSLILA